MAVNIRDEVVRSILIQKNHSDRNDTKFRLNWMFTAFKSIVNATILWVVPTTGELDKFEAVSSTVSWSLKDTSYKEPLLHSLSLRCPARGMSRSLSITVKKGMTGTVFNPPSTCLQNDSHDDAFDSSVGWKSRMTCPSENQS